jgi:hypothetical protein
MRNVLSQRATIVVATLLSTWAFGLDMAHGAPISFKVPLSGGQEVPPVFPAGAGMAELTYDPATRVVTWTVTYRALSSPVTMAQFHGPAQPGKNAAAELLLIKQGSPLDNPINGQATLTPDQARQFMDGEWYINIDTRDHPEGEIRGQILMGLQITVCDVQNIEFRPTDACGCHSLGV